MPLQGGSPELHAIAICIDYICREYRDNGLSLSDEDQVALKGYAVYIAKSLFPNDVYVGGLTLEDATVYSNERYIDLDAHLSSSRTLTMRIEFAREDGHEIVYKLRMLDIDGDELCATLWSKLRLLRQDIQLFAGRFAGYLPRPWPVVPPGTVFPELDTSDDVMKMDDRG